MKETRKPTTAPVRRCRVCGCTDADCSGCIAKTGRHCRWVAKDLCSACVCDMECNKCPLVSHPNSRMITLILNRAYAKFGEKFYKIVEDACPNLTCCFDCRIDDFTHMRGCVLNRSAKHP